MRLQHRLWHRCRRAAARPGRPVTPTRGPAVNTCSASSHSFQRDAIHGCARCSAHGPSTTQAHTALETGRAPVRAPAARAAAHRRRARPRPRARRPRRPPPPPRRARPPAPPPDRRARRRWPRARPRRARARSLLPPEQPPGAPPGPSCLRRARYRSRGWRPARSAAAARRQHRLGLDERAGHHATPNSWPLFKAPTSGAPG